MGVPSILFFTNFLFFGSYIDEECTMNSFYGEGESSVHFARRPEIKINHSFFVFDKYLKFISARRKVTRNIKILF